VAEYLTAAVEDDNPDVFLAAVGNVAKARGMSAVAERTGLGRESLYKALASGAKPRYDTVVKVLHSLGVKLTVSGSLTINEVLRSPSARSSRRRRGGSCR
jgi:probable addiction module antidote protein